MQIVEIIGSNKDLNRQSEYEPVIGIDFGTTNSVVAYSIDKNPKTFLDHKNRDLIPSLISYENGKLEVGAIGSERYVYSIKRLLGKTSQEITESLQLKKLSNFEIDKSSSRFRLKIGTEYLELSAIASEIFKYLKTMAEDELCVKITKAVVTVPAYFDDAAKSAVMLSARFAGLEIIRMLSEPSAAAYAYGLTKNAKGKYIVYDLGGGTFDVSALHMSEGVLQVIASAGNNMLGGDDFDNLIVRYFCDKYDINSSYELTIKARLAKEMLSHNTIVELDYQNIRLSISRNLFEGLILSSINKTLDLTRQVIEEAEIDILSGIVIVGGSSRIPLIKRMLSDAFKARIYDDIDPDRAVVYGAALQAENLTRNPHSLLIDVLPLSLGIETYGGAIEKIILRNTPLPFSVTREFTTYADYQTGMQFHVLQGEREMSKDCRSLGYFELDGLSCERAGAVKVEVTFAVDLDGVLSVSANQKGGGVMKSLTIRPSYGLSESEIEEMIRIAYANAAEDHHAKLLKEAVIDAETLLNRLGDAVSLTVSSSVCDYKEIKQVMKMLQSALDSDKPDRDLILNLTDKLKEVSEEFICSQTNFLINNKLSGKNIYEF